MARDTITVIMAVYNVAATITETLRSVLNQTYRELSILIIDDCSTDGSDFILKNFAKEDSRISYVRMTTNQGVAYMRNYGLDHAKTDWVAFLDGDDIWREDKIEKQVSFRDRMLRGDVPMYLENGDPNPDYPAVIFSSTAYMDYKGNRYGYILHAPDSVKYKKLLKQNVISFSSALTNKTILDKFPVDGNLHEDFYMWLLLLKKGFVAYGIDEPLLTYRIDRDSASGNKWAAAKKNYNVYKKLRFGSIKSLYYMFCYARRNSAKYKRIKNS
ncbi:MAG: glycosyltransferase [Lachnospiraceae bacterium]|nr:glycosyltransferase [Lachnospiraceae bacterium]